MPLKRYFHLKGIPFGIVSVHMGRIGDGFINTSVGDNPKDNFQKD
jgi:hypothetical protein